MTIEAQLERLQYAVEGLLAAVSGLREDEFLGPINGRSGWSPRDIVAHLIGWNRYVIEGGRQIVRGELPFYDLDPGADYGKVNAALIRLYPATDRESLGREMEAAAGELSQFLLDLAEAVWRRDHGVRHDGAVVTIENTVEELIADYHHHRKQIENLPNAGLP